MTDFSRKWPKTETSADLRDRFLVIMKPIIADAMGDDIAEDFGVGLDGLLEVARAEVFYQTRKRCGNLIEELTGPWKGGEIQPEREKLGVLLANKLWTLPEDGPKN